MIFIRTSLFWISFAGALNAGEIEIYQGPDSKIIERIDQSTIDDLEFFEKKYMKGSFDVLERENNKQKMYSYGFYQMWNANKWKYKRKAT